MRKRKIVRSINGMKCSWKDNKDRNRHKNSIKGAWASSVGLSQRHKAQHLHHKNVSPWGRSFEKRTYVPTDRYCECDCWPWRQCCFLLITPEVHWPLTFEWINQFKKSTVNETLFSHNCHFDSIKIQIEEHRMAGFFCLDSILDYEHYAMTGFS